MAYMYHNASSLLLMLASWIVFIAMDQYGSMIFHPFDYFSFVIRRSLLNMNSPKLNAKESINVAGIYRYQRFIPKRIPSAA